MDFVGGLKYKSCSYLLTLITFSLMFLFVGCADEGEDPDPNNNNDDSNSDTSTEVTMSPSTTYQEMVGFGGALTWYCDRVTSSAKKDEIMDLIVDDLGADIVRLKNWYYPANYPDNKGTASMEVSWFKQHFDATDEIYDLIKTRSADVKILFSSWGPPSALKSNNDLEEGTLKKENGAFMYGAYATYWEDILDNISFDPDYLSIQNEPNYTNPGWETCEWAAIESSFLPGYANALDTVYEKIKDRPDLPVIIGPESANLSNNSFKDFADQIKDLPYLGVYAYHPYNLNESSSINDIATYMQRVGDYTDKPNFMTEYSGMSWFKTARLINNALKNANSSAYIYWELMWDENSENAMIQVDGSGNYELTPFYYLIKHYAKNINEGDQRIDVSTSDTSLDVVAFKSSDGNTLTIILLNTDTSDEEVKFTVDAGTVNSIAAWQSTEDELFTELTDLSTDKAITLTGKSVTTVVLDI